MSNNIKSSNLTHGGFRVNHEEQAQIKRNKRIIEQYKTGFYSYNKLARVYHLSPQRIAQIIKEKQKEKQHEIPTV